MNRLTSIIFNDESILKIIRALDVNKAHGHDDISIQMIKLCDKSIIPAISLIYKNCINSGTFPNIWKKSSVVPVHEKGDKQVVDNYRPVSLLPIFSKTLERLIHCLNFFMKMICLMRIIQDSDHLTQGTILGLLLFLIYINDLSNNLPSTTTHFADDTFLFSVLNDVYLSQFNLNSDLKNI